MIANRTGPALIAVAMTLLVVGAASTAAQQNGAPARAGTEVGNFGDVPFSSPQIVITRAEDRAAWRKLEDKHIKERRELEDKYDGELRALRTRQADEREATLKGFAR